MQIVNGCPAGTIRWINVEMKFRTTSRRYFNPISTLFQCQMPAGWVYLGLILFHSI